MAATPGLLICVGGAPGAGKTTVGALVAAGGGLCLVDLDSVTTPLVEAFAEALGVVADLDAPRFAALREARYACLGDVAADNLRVGRDVVAVAPFTSEAADAGAWRERARTWGATRVVLCWLDVDVDVTARRVAERGLPRDVAKGDGRTGEGEASRAGDATASGRSGVGATRAGEATASGGVPRALDVDRRGVDVVADGTRPAGETAARILGAAGRHPAPEEAQGP